MSKFQIGDIVVIKYGNKTVPNAYYPQNMKRYEGRDAEIMGKKSCGHYNLNIDGGVYCWDESWIAHFPEYITTTKGRLSDFIDDYGNVLLPDDIIDALKDYCETTKSKGDK